ncbi:MAG: hypothetical protein ABI836_16440 [Gemmatimonadota bacterium]
MKAYWIKIAFGACAIFAVGMVIMGMGRRGVSRVREAIVNQSISLGAQGAPFRVDGRQFGLLSLVNLQPIAKGGLPHVNLTVRLDPDLESSELSRLKTCDLVASTDEGRISDSEGLRCVAASEAANSDLVEVGTVRLDPSGETLRLFVPQSTLDHSNWFHRFQNHSAPAAAAAPAAPVASRANVQLQADSAGAFLMIRDEHGKPVFQLNADSNGAFIQVRDSNGQEVLRFQADAKGVKGNIHSN